MTRILAPAKLTLSLAVTGVRAGRLPRAPDPKWSA